MQRRRAISRHACPPSKGYSGMPLATNHCLPKSAMICSRLGVRWCRLGQIQSYTQSALEGELTAAYHHKEDASDGGAHK
jgi:hypothetical protein